MIRNTTISECVKLSKTLSKKVASELNIPVYLYDLASEENVSCFRGDEQDVVKRLYDASLEFDADYILNIADFARGIIAKMIGIANANASFHKSHEKNRL